MNAEELAAEFDRRATFAVGIAAQNELRSAAILVRANLRTTNPLHDAGADMNAALEGLKSDVESLMSESLGIAGLSENGDLAEWDTLGPGGQYEDWIGVALKDAEVAIAKAKGTAQPEEPGHD